MKSTTLFATLPFSLILFLGVKARAGYYDSGFIQFQQPNGTTFIGREYGDEFIFYRETELGYRYVKAEGDWYYYATVNGEGNLVASNARVAIDSPPPSSYHAEYTGQKLAEIQMRRSEFESQVETNNQWFQQQQAASKAIHQPTLLNIAVILVEFKDERHARTSLRPGGYLFTDYQKMLFSSNGEWFDTTVNNGTHPEGDRVYGSMRDYYWQMSRPNGDTNALIVTGEVINHQTLTPRACLCGSSLTPRGSTMTSGCQSPTQPYSTKQRRKPLHAVGFPSSGGVLIRRS